MLPNSVINALVFFGLQFAEKVPAMINFTQGKSQILSCVKTAEISTIITAKKMVVMLKMQDLIKALEEAGIKYCIP